MLPLPPLLVVLLVLSFSGDVTLVHGGELVVAAAVVLMLGRLSLLRGGSPLLPAVVVVVGAGGVGTTVVLVGLVLALSVP